MKRGGYIKRKTPLRVKSVKLSRKPKKAPRSIAKLKKDLWALCRQIAHKIYPHNCYTCGTTLIWGSPIMQLGHFIPKSVCSKELAFDLKNLRWQCRYCNQFKNGDWRVFEANLIRDNGIAYVEELKARDQATRGKQYDSLWYQAKVEEYQTLLSSLQQTP